MADLDCSITMPIRSLLFLLGFIFLFSLLWHSWQTIELLLRKTDWWLFTISIIINLIGTFIVSKLFQQLLAKYGVATTYPKVCQIFFFAQVAKYIPGKIWALWYQATLLNTVGSTTALVFTNLELMGILILHTTALSLSLLFWQHNFLISLFFFVLSGILCWQLLHHCHLFKILHRFIPSLKHLPITCQPQCLPQEIIGFYILFTITYLSSQLIMLHAVFKFSLDESSHYIAYLGLAWMVGVFAVIVPGGMGIKEIFFIFFAQLSNQPPSLEMLTAIAVISRFWLILQEILGVMLIFIWKRYFLNHEVTKS